MNIGDLDTPALVIDLDVMMHNIRRLQEHLDAHGIANRPHIKTHKVPAIAHLQLVTGARGITCQKLGEAEVMADAGIGDILITYNILGPEKLERLARLAKRTDVTVTVDSLVVAQGISGAVEARRYDSLEGSGFCMAVFVTEDWFRASFHRASSRRVPDYPLSQASSTPVSICCSWIRRRRAIVKATIAAHLSRNRTRHSTGK